MTAVWRHDAVGQAELRRSGAVSPSELVQAAVERARRLDDIVNSIVHRRFEAAIADAAVLSLAGAGAFAGVPFAIKDWKCLQEGEPSTWGTRALVAVDRRATFSTVLAERYATAGFVSIGRTNLPELAFGPPTTEPDAHGPCRNPWDSSRSVGGSSGGSAAVVAAGIVPAANASDGGGSLRIPAACCGLVGLKVSRGRITNAPHADGRGVKVEGHLARTVRDVAAILDATAGNVAGDTFVAPPAATTFLATASRAPDRLRIGLMTTAPLAMNPDRPVDPGAVRAAEHVAATMATMGHSVEIAHPAGLDEPLSTPSLYAAERATLRAEMETLLGRPLTAADVEPRTWAMFELATGIDGVRVLAELEREQRWSRRVHEWWADGFDLLLTPTLGRAVPGIGELKETADDPLGAAVAGFPLAWFTYPFNVTGQPAISIPVTSEAGEPLPSAAQLVAAWGREDLLLTVAARLEEAFGWPGRWPDGIS